MAYDPWRDEEPTSPLSPVPYNPPTGAYVLDKSSPLQPVTPPIQPSQSALQPTAQPTLPSPLEMPVSRPIGYTPDSFYQQQAIAAPPPSAQPTKPETDAEILRRGGVPPSWRDMENKTAKPEEGFFGKLGTAFGAGVDTMQENLKATGNAYLGDNRAIEANAANLAQVQQAKPAEAKQFMQAWEAAPKEFSLDGLQQMGGAGLNPLGVK